MALCILFVIHFAVMGLLLWIKCIKNSVARLALFLTSRSRDCVKLEKRIFLKSELRSQICLASLTTRALEGDLIGIVGTPFSRHLQKGKQNHRERREDHLYITEKVMGQ